MLNLFFRFLLAFNATALILIVYVVKQGIVLDCIDKKLPHLPHLVTYTCYILCLLALTFLSLLISRALPTDNISTGGHGSVIEIEQANNAYLPTYLGYFFVGLDVPDNPTLVFVFVLLFVFTFLSQALYFNPLFLIFGYHFYYLTTSSSVKIFVITKKSLKRPSTIRFHNLKRINDFTFIDNEK